MIAYMLSKIITMVYGMLYPAYCSYKAVKTKDVKEYVHWMMYWIVFSIFSFFEVFADTFIGCWFPFYYELKIIFMVWMLSPTTCGGTILYRRLIHPSLTRHEPEIDAYLAEFKLRTSNLIVQWGSRAFNYVTETLLNTLMRIEELSEEEHLKFYGPYMVIPPVTHQHLLTVLPIAALRILLPNALEAGAGDYRFINKVAKSYSGEGFDQPDMNRNNPPPPRDLSPGDPAHPDYYPYIEQFQQADMRHRGRYIADTMRYGSVDDNLGQYMDVSNQQHEMMNASASGEELESRPPPKLRSSSRKKKEANIYGTMPRAPRTKKAAPK